jgi:hypothetical protein
LCGHDPNVNESQRTFFITTVTWQRAPIFRIELSPNLGAAGQVLRESEVAVPAIGDDEPCAEASPDFEILAAVGDGGAVELADGDGEATDLHGHVVGVIDTDGLEAELFVTLVAELAHKPLDGLGTIGGIVVRGHEDAVLGKERGDLIVVAGVECGNKVLRKTANDGLNVRERTRVREGTRIGPVHLTTSWGKAQGEPFGRTAGAPLTATILAKTWPVEGEKISTGVEGQVG